MGSGERRQGPPPDPARAPLAPRLNNVVALKSEGDRETTPSALPGVAREHELWRRVREHGDRAAHSELVDRYLPLARRLAARYSYRPEERDDVDQVASLALVKAIDRFEPDRGSRFASFAIPTIVGELKRFFRDHAWAVRMPRQLKERTAKISDATSVLSASLGRPPTVPELAEHAGISVEEVVEAIEASSAYDAVSLNLPLGQADSGDSLLETLGDSDPAFELAEYAASIAPALREMPERERVILHLRFGEDLTQSEIAARLGISQMHVSRLLRRSLKELRSAAGEAEPAAGGREAAGDA